MNKRQERSLSVWADALSTKWEEAQDWFEQQESPLTVSVAIGNGKQLAWNWVKTEQKLLISDGSNWFSVLEASLEDKILAASFVADLKRKLTRRTKECSLAIAVALERFDKEHEEVETASDRDDTSFTQRSAAEILEARSHAVSGGCCNRFADQMACDCLEQAKARARN